MNDAKINEIAEALALGAIPDDEALELLAKAGMSTEMALQLIYEVVEGPEE